MLVWDGKNDAIYHPCRNIAEGDQHFQVHPEDWVAAEDAGPIRGRPQPPQRIHGAQRVGHRVLPPLGRALVDRDARGRLAPHHPQRLGCAWPSLRVGCRTATLARDAYGHMPDFERGPAFWTTRDLFGDGLAQAGFERVEDGPHPGDALLMSIRGGGVTNHCAIYMGGGRVLHHLPGRLSREEDRDRSTGRWWRLSGRLR